MRTKKKLLSLFLAIAMVLTCVSSVVFADNAGVSVANFKVFKGTTLDTLDDASEYLTNVESGDIVDSDVTDGNNALQISAKTVAVKPTYWPTGNKPKTVSFDLKCASNWADIGYFILVDANGNGVGNSMSSGDGALFSTKATMINGTCQEDKLYKFCGRNWVAQDSTAYAEIDYTKSAHYEYTFTYSADKVTIALTITGVQQTGESYTYGSTTREYIQDNTATATRDFSLVLDSTNNITLDTKTLTPTFVSTVSGNSTGSMVLDNLNVTSYADEALDYLDSNELFTKNSEAVTADDTDNAVAAREAYEALGADVKAVLNADNGADVAAFLDAVDAKIESFSVSEKVAAYKNAYAAVLNKSVDSMTEDDLITFAKAVDAYNAFTSSVQSDSEITALKALIDEKSEDVLANIKTSRSVDFSQSKWIRENYFADTTATVADADAFVTYVGSAEFASTDGTPITHSEVTWQYPNSAEFIYFYPVSGNDTCLTARPDGSTASGYLAWFADYGNNAKTFVSDLQNTKNKGENNGVGLWNISATKTPNGWVKFEFDYDWSQYAASGKLTVKTTATLSGKNVLNSAGQFEGTVYDKEDDTYKSTVFTTYTLSEQDPANVAFKLVKNTNSINIKAMGVQTAKAAADEFNLKYSAITADSADFVTAKAELEKLNTKAAELVSANIKNVLSAKTSATFVSDDFSDEAKSEINWVGGVITPSFDRNLTNITKKNTLMVSGMDKATLTEAVWPKGTKPVYMSVTYSRSGYYNPYMIFAGDTTVAQNGGFGLYFEEVAHKTATLNNGTFASQGNGFFIGAPSASNENDGTMNAALKSEAYNNTYWTTLDMKFDYSVAGKVAVTMDIYIYSNDNSDRVVFSSVKRTYTVGDMSDFRPYFYANNGTLKIADFKYYTEEQLAKNTVFADEGANIYLGDTAKGALSFSGSVAVKDSIAYKALTTENYAANLGNSVVINDLDVKIAANEIDALLPITEIGAQVWAKTVPTAADIKTVSSEESASTFGVVISGTNVDPMTKPSAIQVHTKLYVKLGDYTVESNEITMSRNKALRKTAAYYVNQGKITDYTAEDALDSTKTDITTIKNDVYNCLGITE